MVVVPVKVLALFNVTTPVPELLMASLPAPEITLPLFTVMPPVLVASKVMVAPLPTAIPPVDSCKRLPVVLARAPPLAAPLVTLNPRV